MSLALIAVLPFLGALLPGFAIRWGRSACAGMAGLVTAIALVGVLQHAPAVLAGQVVQARLDWVPALGLNANFMLDGLGLIFALLILGIGLLIILYARFYLDEADPMGRFFTCLLLFQGAMLGIVLSDNILLLLIFWELTSLSSFLLIGFWHHLPQGRQGARMALTVTGAGGLAMIAGMLLLGQIAGSYDLSVILEAGATVRSSPLYLPALILILLGCFTKSAQFPFHFWLPHAMAAPTPVSAYLHSATMVKAGIFLLARLWPVLAGSPEWFAIVTTTGLVTMLLGAAIALFKDDMKALLAYSTVSHLGLITMLLGIGTKAAAVAAVVHILCHATFKAALFLSAGIVEHATHTRDLRRLGGLARLMPLTFALAGLAALSMAGLPPLNGFLSKELMLAAAAQTVWAGQPWLLGLLATLAAMLSAAYAFRFVVHGFLGPVRKDYPHAPHDPGAGLLLAPLVLVALVVGIGLVPTGLFGALVDAAAGRVTGGQVDSDLALWHGVASPALWMSLAAVGGGIAVLGAYPALQKVWAATARPDAKRGFDAGIRALAALARRSTDSLHDGTLSRSVGVALLAIVGGGIYAFTGGGHAPGARSLTPVEATPLIGWAALMVATAGAVWQHRSRFAALLLVSIVGLMVALGFAYFSAPDLALTQITVEVVTLILMLLALNFLPRTTPSESPVSRRVRDALIAGVTGLGAGALAYALMIRDFAFPTISAFHLAQSYPGAGGTNAVNTIIVDFRGYDTYGEITVLGIAALVIFALADSILRNPHATARLRANRAATPRAGGWHPQLMGVVTRALLPMAMMVGVFIYLRGHNLPGGGFVAGLVFAIALLMQHMASGFQWAQGRMPVDYHALIGAGVLIASLCGAAAWAFGLPFLTSGYDYFAVWPLEPIGLATAAIFDLGVFLSVLGAVMLTLASISRMSVRAGEPADDAAFDNAEGGR
ncbi:MAG: monovalent cation/H+ antiporter subunit A [Pseudomonadota bacterium]